MEIKKIILLIFAITLIHCAAFNKHAQIEKPSSSDLLYVIEPVFVDGILSFNVDLYFRGNDQGEDKIVLPAKWAGQSNLHQFITNLTTLTPGTELKPTDMENIKNLTHKPGQIIHLRYQVVEVTSKNLSNVQRLFVQKFKPDHFHFFSATFFVHPYWDILKKIKISLEWVRLPENWQISNSFGTNVRSQIMTESLFDFKYSLFVGGNYRTYRMIINDNPVYIALRGQWSFSDQEYLDLLEKIVATQRGFWQDHNYPYFLITLSPTETTCCHYAGAAAFNAFTMIAAQKEINTNFIHLLNHEFFHNWLGSIINSQKPGELTFWFIEGFSDYYARLFGLREGLISLKDYLDDLNKVIKNYHSSAVKELRNSEVAWNFWQDRSMNKMPYYKGDILAHFWNEKILKKSAGKESLDTLMHDLLNRAKFQNFLVSNQSVAELLKKYLGDNQDIQRYIEKGEPLDMMPASLGPCVYLETGKIPQYKINLEMYQKNPQICLSYFGGPP